MLRHRFFCLLSLCALQTPLCAQQWMGLETQSQTIISLEASIDEASNNGLALNLATSLGEQFWLDLAFSNNTVKDDANTFHSSQIVTQLSWFISDATELRIAYQYEGENNELEMRQNNIQWDYNPYPWNISVCYALGEVDLFTRNDLNLNQLPNKINSEFNAYNLTLGWWFDYFKLSLSQTHYDYDKDLTLLASRPRLQLILKPEVFIHSSILLTQQQTISLQIPLQQHTLFLHLQAIQSAVDNSTVDVLSVEWQQDLASNTRLLIHFNQLLNQSQTWAVAVGLEWSI